MGKKKANTKRGSAGGKKTPAAVIVQEAVPASQQVVAELSEDANPGTLSNQISALRASITHLKAVEEETKKAYTLSSGELESVESRMKKLKEFIKKYLERIVEVEFECDDDDEDQDSNGNSSGNKSSSMKGKNKSKTSSGVRKQVASIRKHQAGKRDLQALLRERDQRLDELRDQLAKTSEALTASSDATQKQSMSAGECKMCGHNEAYLSLAGWIYVIRP